jgi:PBP1b-binding outer membrane lipoprotein LpoB
MKQFKFYIVLSIVIFLSSCSSIKKGFVNEKKDNSDEFLVEKKSPLVMPPDYNELPIPKEENVEKETNDIKSLISKTKNDEIKENLDVKNSTFESSILEKIKNN